MRERTIKAAEHFGILENLRALENEILNIKSVPEVDFDVDNFDELHQIIVIPKYDIPVTAERYYSLRQNTLSNILICCARADLWATGDIIEDMGEHWYIVRKAGVTWGNVKKQKTAQ